MSEYSEKINRQFDEEILKFKENPPSACDQKTALKLLREFERDTIAFASKFWPNSVEKYFAAIAQGTIFWGEERFSHSEAIATARKRVDALSYEDVAKAFIYGVTRGVPAYRTALPAYLHIKNIPEHDDRYLCADPYHTSPRCDFCDYVAPSVETKMSFMWINSRQYHRIFIGGYLGRQSLEASSFLLREFAKLPKVTVTQEDYQVFIDSLKLAEQLPSEKKIGAYKDILQKSKPLPLKAKEIPSYLDILGYLDILHTDEHRGITKVFIRTRDMKEAEEHKNDYGYPVRFWRAENGVDWERVKDLFSDIIYDA